MNRYGMSEPERGSAYVVALVLLVILGGISAALLQITVADQSRTIGTREGIRARYAAEAGANLAIADITAGGSGNLGAADAPLSFGGGAYWVRTIAIGADTYRIESFARIGEQVRALEVVAEPRYEAIFTKALFGDLDLAASGTVFTDSYDSSDSSYGAQAVHTDPVTGATYALAQGSLGSNGNIVINGSVTILGDARPGPGGRVIVSGGSAHISGSTSPSPSRTPLPPYSYSPPVASSGTLSGSAILSGGAVRYDSISLSGKKTIRVTGDTELYIDGNISFTGKAKLVIESGASLALYNGGSDVKIAGGGAINESNVPGNFTLFSTATAVKVTGNSSFYGAIFAPRAEIDPGGTADLFGSFVGRQVTIHGTANFHFDEALEESDATTAGFRPVSWRVISASGSGL